MLSRNNLIITDTNHIVRLLLYCPHCILPSWFCVLSSCHLYLVRNCTQSNNVSDFSDSVHVIMIVIMMPCHYCLTVSPTNEDVHVSDPPRAGLSWRPCSSQYLIYNSKTQYSAAPASHQHPLLHTGWHQKLLATEKSCGPTIVSVTFCAFVKTCSF